MHDTILIEDQPLFMVGINGGRLFDPYELGLHPLPHTTSCWRGYVCEYKSFQGKFLLDNLQINIDPQEETSINGVKPERDRRRLFSHVYASLHLPIPFTGNILAAGEFIQELYVHMGFHPAWKYKKVLELILSDGEVIEIRDISKQMEDVRKEMVKSPLTPGPNANREQIEKWIESTFRRDHHK